MVRLNDSSGRHTIRHLYAHELDQIYYGCSSL